MWIDRWIEIDCKDKVYVDQWSGDVAVEQPSYIVGLPDRTFEGNQPTIREYGRIEDADDISWIKQVAYRLERVGGARIETSAPMVARIHQLKLRRDGYEGFEIEVVTGVDAEAMLKAAKRAETISTFKQVWWLVPVALVILWWVF